MRTVWQVKLRLLYHIVNYCLTVYEIYHLNGNDFDNLPGFQVKWFIFLTTSWSNYKAKPIVTEHSNLY